MMNGNPLYSRAGKFVYADGRIREVSGEFVVQGLKINKMNYLAVARELALPHSLLLSLMSGTDYHLIDDSMPVAHFDIECDSEDNFEFGVVNNEKFDDSKKLLDKIMEHQVITAFNTFRYDFPILAKLHPNYFDHIRLKNFDLVFLKSKLCLDMLFYFQIWKPPPAQRSHRLDALAEVLGYKREHATLDDKTAKCVEDVKILGMFYPYAREIYNFLTENFKIDAYSLSSIPSKWMGKARRWLFQSYCIQHGIVPKLIQRRTTLKPNFFKYCKVGWHENLKEFDISRSYPQTAVNIGATLYTRYDFANYMRFLMTAREMHPQTADCWKGIANQTIGDMGSQKSLLRDEAIMANIWLTFKSNFEKWIRKIKKRNVVYSYTDCVYTPLEKVPPFDNYEIRLQKKVKWMMIYNIERILGMTENDEIFKTHFTRLLPALKLYGYVDEVIERKLKANPKKFLQNPKIKLDFHQLPTDVFKIVGRKVDDVCRSVDLLTIWTKLPYGFYEIFLSRKGVTIDPQKIDYRRYEKLMNQYLSLFKVRKGMIKEDE